MWEELIYLRCREFFKSKQYPAKLEAEVFKFIFGDGGLIYCEDAEDFDFHVCLFKEATVKLHKSFDVCSDAFFGIF